MPKKEYRYVCTIFVYSYIDDLLTYSLYIDNSKTAKVPENAEKRERQRDSI